MYRTLLERSRSAALVTALLTAAGCGGGGDAGGGASGGGDAAPMASPVDAATAGDAAGMVTFSGSPPTMAAIDMSDEDACASRHTTPPAEESVVVGDGGGLANVFVYVKEGLDLDFPTPSQAVVMDQDGCVYRPHVLGVQTGQDITLRNSDSILHNINASPTENRPFNVSQPVNMDTNRSFRVAEVMIPVRCDVHGWMNAYIGVLDHPYFAVSDASGAVALDGLPPGDYVVEAWHERYGTMEQSITVTTGGTAELSFEFNESMAGNPVPLGEPVDLMHPEGHRTADHQ